MPYNPILTPLTLSEFIYTMVYRFQPFRTFRSPVVIYTYDKSDYKVLNPEMRRFLRSWEKKSDSESRLTITFVASTVRLEIRTFTDQTSSWEVHDTMDTMDTNSITDLYRFLYSLSVIYDESGEIFYKRVNPVVSESYCSRIPGNTDLFDFTKIMYEMCGEWKTSKDPISIYTYKRFTEIPCLGNARVDKMVEMWNKSVDNGKLLRFRLYFKGYILRAYIEEYIAVSMIWSVLSSYNDIDDCPVCYLLDLLYSSGIIYDEHGNILYRK